MRDIWPTRCQLQTLVWWHEVAAVCTMVFGDVYDSVPLPSFLTSYLIVLNVNLQATARPS